MSENIQDYSIKSNEFPFANKAIKKYGPKILESMKKEEFDALVFDDNPNIIPEILSQLPPPLETTDDIELPPFDENFRYEDSLTQSGQLRVRKIVVEGYEAKLREIVKNDPRQINQKYIEELKNLRMITASHFANQHDSKNNQN